MGLSIVLFVSIFLAWVDQMNAYKILVYSPTMGHSHVNYMGKIADSLLDAGHEVLMYLPVWDPDVHTNGTKRAPALRVNVMEGTSPFANHPIKLDPFNENFNMMDDSSMAVFMQIFVQLCEGQVSNKQLMQALRDQHFDVAISEYYDYCPFAIFKLLGIPANIAAFAMPVSEIIGDLFGLPQPLSYVPSFLGPLSDDMSFMERATNVYTSQSFRKILEKELILETEILRRYHGNNFPRLEDLAKKTAVAFINADEFVEFPRPITHRIIYVGGIGVSKAKNISTDLMNLVEASDKGIILLSFGSIANSTLLPIEKKLAILRATANFPEYTFIWKYERPEEDWELFMNYTNVYPMKWVPQVDLLNHNKVKVFITHGGLNSMMEAIYSGTPTVAVPLFADQEHNVAVAVKRGVSVFVSKQNLNTESLTTALREILQNGKYAKNADRLAQMIARKPLQAKELIVKWTEFVAEFQDLSHLDIAGRDFSFVKYFLIDIIVPVILLVIVSLFTSLKLGLLVARKTSLLISSKEKQL